jgi:hypothetical protein
MIVLVYIVVTVYIVAVPAVLALFVAAELSEWRERRRETPVPARGEETPESSEQAA